MYYFAVLQTPERELNQADLQAEMQAYTDFHARAAEAIRAGDALAPVAEAVRIDGGPDRPVITDGPFAEGAEVAGGFYVFEAENLDEALELARQIPAASYGAVEVWPMVHWSAPDQPTTGNDWLALLLHPADQLAEPGTPEWEDGARRHVDFYAAAGEHVLGGAPLHLPATATTVRVRGSEVLLTDGPFAEGAEVASGFYLLRAGDREEAAKIAGMIPAAAVQVRRLAGVSGL
ncbi:YciI family protein [Mycolicibacterium chlorophenolicum]|uniref:YCII-related domain protein n=1 Tax=Mycolicibacterium chlorophenolicum TaxID=37916 RepID=A0A0J6VJQ0_9MYCO|nr:YciI family protein [Mycolicibacterium chlorophenolicum]KMO69673.1 YCII-related domain protein [Mycolicibacterium chlorophenolicum]